MNRILFAFALFVSSEAFTQPAQTTIQGRTFYVYPLRSNETEIPPYFANIPDGEYVMFCEYDFKKKFMKKEYALTDTTRVRAVFSVKNNMPEGKAVFYNYDKSTAESGSYSKGLREGVWEKKNEYYYDKKRVSISNQHYTYHEGLLDGPFWEYSYYGKPPKKNTNIQLVDSLHLSQKGQYKKGHPTGKWINCSGSNEIWREYTYADSVSWYGNIYDQMYPRTGGDYEHKLHGKEVRRVGYVSPKTETILHQYGTVAYFDTLFQYDGSPEYVLVKKDKNLPDSVATFILTNYYQDRSKTAEELKNKRLRIAQVIEFRGGEKVSRVDYTYEGAPDEKEYYQPYYKGLKKGRLYLKNITYYPGQINYTYDLYGYYREFKKFVNNNDTTLNFTITDIDTVKMTYLCQRYNAEKSLGVSWIDYLHGYMDTTSEAYSYGRVYEALDSSVIFKDGVRFSGIIKGFYHRKLSKQKTVNENGTWVIYVNRQYTPSQLPFSYHEYAEIKNGRGHGKMVVVGKLRGSVEKNIYYMNRGMRHGTDITTVYNFKLNKDEREIAAKHGITSKRVTFVKESIEYENDLPKGHWEIREATGVLRESRNYTNGLLHGEFIERHEDGTLRESAYYKEGQLDGKYIRRYTDGVLMEEAEYLAGNLNGALKKYKSNGEPSFTAYAKDNNMEGQAILYNELGLMEWKLEFEANDSVPYYYFDPNDYSSRYRTFVWNNENIVSNLQTRFHPYPASFKYTEYFYTGRVAAEGVFKKGRMTGLWKFYDLDGNLIHEVDFKSEELQLPHDTLYVMGKIKSYYSNGKVKSTGHIESFTRDYDCKSKKNVYSFWTIYENYWEPDGRQTLVKGNGAFTEYDEHGIRLSSGEYFEYQKNGFWKTWDKDGKLNSAGHYVNNLQEGSWWYGDLEGLSFIDNACFDISSDVVLQEISEMKKNLNIKHSIYIKGNEVSSHDFNMNMNKEKKWRERYEYSGSVPNF